jgi:hypothetical protein
MNRTKSNKIAKLENGKIGLNKQNSRLAAAHIAHNSRLAAAHIAQNTRLAAAQFEQNSRLAAAHIASSLQNSLCNADLISV